jgi:hypothetical protein
MTGLIEWIHERRSWLGFGFLVLYRAILDYGCDGVFGGKCTVWIFVVMVLRCLGWIVVGYRSAALFSRLGSTSLYYPSYFLPRQVYLERNYISCLCISSSLLPYQLLEVVQVFSRYINHNGPVSRCRGRSRPIANQSSKPRTSCQYHHRPYCVRGWDERSTGQDHRPISV